MKSILLIAAAASASLTLCSCGTLKDVPITFAYRTGVAGHAMTAAYSNKDGLTFYGERRTRVQAQK